MGRYRRVISKWVVELYISSVGTLERLYKNKQRYRDNQDSVEIILVLPWLNIFEPFKVTPTLQTDLTHLDPASTEVKLRFHL